MENLTEDLVNTIDSLIDNWTDGNVVKDDLERRLLMTRQLCKEVEQMNMKTNAEAEMIAENLETLAEECSQVSALAKKLADELDARPTQNDLIKEIAKVHELKQEIDQQKIEITAKQMEISTQEKQREQEATEKAQNEKRLLEEISALKAEVDHLNKVNKENAVARMDTVNEESEAKRRLRQELQQTKRSLEKLQEENISLKRKRKN